MTASRFLFVLFGSELGVGVGDADVELLGAFDDQLALLRGDGVGDLGGIHAVLHQQNFQIRNVIHQEFLRWVRFENKERNGANVKASKSRFSLLERAL